MDESRSGWRTVRFGDVVRNVDEAVRDPQTCDLERFIGLEHIDPESLRIKRWGLIADGTSFTRKFTAGQVLFGKRRAYQRKVAVADFDGLCSSDILVFEPADDRLLPELLPFILQTEGFFQHALGTSAGSLSPRTRWRDLAAYEFPLLPLDEQRRIAEILWAAEEVIQRFEESLSLLAQAKERHFENQMIAPAEDVQSVVTLDDICTVQNGQVDPTVPPYNQMVHIAPDDIESETGRILEMRTAEEDRIRSGNYEFSAQAVLYSKIRPNLRKVAYPKFAGVCSADVYPLYPRVDMIEPDYLFHLLLSRSFTEYAVMHSVRSAIPKINRENLLQYTFTLPSVAKQQRIVGDLQMFANASGKCAQHIGQTRKVKSVLLNRLCQPERK